jgi:hypothetical protein
MTISDTTAADRNFQKNAMASFVQIAALVILAVWCLRIIAPFVSIILWGMIIAVALYPLHMSLAGKLGGQEKLSATLFVLLGLTILLVPTYILTDSSVTALRTVGTQLNSGAVSINPPDESVAEWPVIGKRVHEIWSDAASNLEATINKFGDQLEQLGGTVLRMAGSMAVGVLQFVVSIIIAGVFLVGARIESRRRARGGVNGSRRRDNSQRREGCTGSRDHPDIAGGDRAGCHGSPGGGDMEFPGADACDHAIAAATRHGANCDLGILRS